MYWLFRKCESTCSGLCTVVMCLPTILCLHLSVVNICCLVFWCQHCSAYLSGTAKETGGLADLQ